MSHWMRPLDTNRWVETVQSFTWRPWIGAIASSTEQRSGRLGFFPFEGFSQGCTVLGLQLLAILGIMVLLPLGMESYLIYLCKRILGWRGIVPADGMTSWK